MDEKTTLEVYKLIQLNVNNKDRANGQLADSIHKKHNYEQEDIIQDLIVRFIEKERDDKFKDSSKLQGLVNRFCYYELVDMDRGFSCQKRADYSKQVEYKEIY